MSQDTSHWRFQDNFNLSLFRNTDAVIDLENNLALRYFKGKDRFIALSSIHYNSSEEQNFAQSGFLHLRYVRSLKPWLLLEAFGQFQTDRPLKIEQRFLQGAGLRFVLHESKNFAFYTGHLAMYEYDAELETGIEHYDWRLSSYLSMDWSLGEAFKWTSVLYYQPRLGNFEDFRFNWQNQWAFKFNQHWSFTLAGNLTYDANPVIDPEIPNFTYRITNGLQLNF